MMAKVSDIKDRSPNPHLVAQLEHMLDLAKKGEVRSMLSVYGWDNDSASRGWALDNRTNRHVILAALTLQHHEFITNRFLEEGDSILSKAIED